MNQVDYLRISLIDKCNFRCLYCMPDSASFNYIPNQNLLSNEEIVTLVRDVFIPLGFRKFRFTGGEPLLRPQLPQLVEAIASLPETEDMAMTTNGFLLSEQAQSLYDAGLQRLNISLDSLNPKTFDRIIGNKSAARWQKTWQGIIKAHEVGFNPLKLNVVVIPGVNDGEILELAALTIKRNWHVRFIEFMPIGNSELFGERAWIDSEELRKQIGKRYGLEAATIKGNGPADIYQIPQAKGTLGFISQMSECFCDRCNRIRLSADGCLRPCLLNETGQVDLKTSLRSGATAKELRQQVERLLQTKAEINFKERDSGTESGVYSRTMSQIGG